ncbi:MAG: MgtC/SapB family protein [Candidatus Komeilibacteria bacterium]|nr:MgtC/SapB family protein [Candidatus Komeilibacteria bacterium]
MTEFDYIIRLVLAVALGGLIGWERQKENKPAGLRTHILVCLGSTLFTMISFMVLTDYAQFAIDPTRIAAGIVTGIGFLCAGSIIQSKERVIGLTTAASIWVVSAVGMAIAFGFFILAAATAFLAVIVLYILEKVEIRFSK